MLFCIASSHDVKATHEKRGRSISRKRLKIPETSTRCWNSDSNGMRTCSKSVVECEWISHKKNFTHDAYFPIVYVNSIRNPNSGVEFRLRNLAAFQFTRTPPPSASTYALWSCIANAAAAMQFGLVVRIQLGVGRRENIQKLSNEDDGCYEIKLMQMIHRTLAEKPPSSERKITKQLFVYLYTYIRIIWRYPRYNSTPKYNIINKHTENFQQIKTVIKMQHLYKNICIQRSATVTDRKIIIHSIFKAPSNFIRYTTVTDRKIIIKSIFTTPSNFIRHTNIMMIFPFNDC